MPFPRPRLTVRRLMIAVAVVAVLLTGWLKFIETPLRTARYNRIAAGHRDYLDTEIWFMETDSDGVNFRYKPEYRDKATSFL